MLSRDYLLHEDKKQKRRNIIKMDYSTAQFLLSLFIILLVLGKAGASDVAQFI